MAGSILYGIDTSYHWPLIGRGLNGFPLAIRALMISEIIRSYPPDELDHIMTIRAIPGCLGMVAGPLITACFLNIDIRIGGFHIKYENISGWLLLIGTVIAQIGVIFFSYDLSREFDLKDDIIALEDETKMFIQTAVVGISNPSDLNAKEIKPIHNFNKALETDLKGKELKYRESWFVVLYNVIITFDPIVLLTMTFYANYFEIAVYRLLPIIIIEQLKYPKSAVIVSFAVLTGFAVLIILVLCMIKIRAKGMLIIGISSLVAMVMVAVSLELISPDYPNGVNDVLILIVVASIGFFMNCEAIFINVVLGKIIFSRNQSFVEGIKITVLRLGSITGSFTAAYFIGYMDIM